MTAPREHPLGCDCSTCLGDGETDTYRAPLATEDPRNFEPFTDELDGLHCPKCGSIFEWKGRTESQRYCGECRWGE